MFVESIAHEVRGYILGLTAWLKSRTASYAMAAALLLVGAILLTIALGIGTAAGFHFIEIRYGIWAAYGVVGGTFLTLSAVSFATGMVLLKRKRELPTPPNVTNLVQTAALPAISRLDGAVRAVAGRETDAYTRLLAGGAVTLLIGWAASVQRDHVPVNRQRK